MQIQTLSDFFPPLLRNQNDTKVSPIVDKSLIIDSPIVESSTVESPTVESPTVKSPSVIKKNPWNTKVIKDHIEPDIILKDDNITPLLNINEDNEEYILKNLQIKIKNFLISYVIY